MGLEVVVENACELGEALRRLTAAGAPASIVMIDGALTMPGAAAPARWVDVRVKTGAAGVSVVAFGNADAAARAMMDQIAAAFR
jgi:hypothetical protein